MSFWSNPGGSISGFFSNPVQSVSNLVQSAGPEIGAIAGYYFGGPIGAGIGDFLGSEASGRSFGQSVGGGLEAFAGSSLFDAYGGGGSSGGGIDPNQLQDPLQQQFAGNANPAFIGPPAPPGAPGGSYAGPYAPTGAPVSDAGYTGTLNGPQGIQANSGGTGPNNTLGGYAKAIPQSLQNMTSGIFPGGGAGGGGLGLNLGTAGSLYSMYQGHQMGKMQDPNLSMYQSRLGNLVSNPASVVNTPGYQFNYDQGLQALSRSQAAGGFGGTGAAPGTGGGSGNFATAAQQYGQNYAMNSYNQQVSQLQGLAQPNLGPIQAGSNMNLMGMMGLINQSQRGG